MTSFPGAFTGRINRPSLPRSNTFNGPPFSNPSRRHHHSGKTVWRFEVKVIVMVIIFMVRIYYLKTRFVKGFARILRVQFCSSIELTSRKFMSDSSIDMKQKSPCTAEFKANGGFSGSPLPNDYFVTGGWLAAKGSFRHREIRGQKFCRQDWRPPVSFTVAVKSNLLPGKFPPMISTILLPAFRGHGHRHHFAIVRIYYREMRFIEGFFGVLAMQSCDVMTQDSRKFMSDSSIDMNQKSQDTAETRPVALWKN